MDWNVVLPFISCRSLTSRFNLRHANFLFGCVARIVWERLNLYQIPRICCCCANGGALENAPSKLRFDLLRMIYDVHRSCARNRLAEIRGASELSPLPLNDRFQEWTEKNGDCFNVELLIVFKATNWSVLE